MCTSTDYPLSSSYLEDLFNELVDLSSNTHLDSTTARHTTARICGQLVAMQPTLLEIDAWLTEMEASCTDDNLSNELRCLQCDCEFLFEGAPNLVALSQQSQPTPPPEFKLDMPIPRPRTQSNNNERIRHGINF